MNHNTKKAIGLARLNTEVFAENTEIFRKNLTNCVKAMKETAAERESPEAMAVAVGGECILSRVWNEYVKSSQKFYMSMVAILDRIIAEESIDVEAFCEKVADEGAEDDAEEEEVISIKATAMNINTGEVIENREEIIELLSGLLKGLKSESE